VANPPSPVTPSFVDTDPPAVQKGQAVATSVKYGAIRHPALVAHEATVHDTEVGTGRDSNPGTHQNLCARQVPLPSILNQPKHVRPKCRNQEADYITVSGLGEFLCVHLIQGMCAVLVYFLLLSKYS
jgi:hypothetical protein